MEPLGTPRKWNIWSLGVENASSPADGFCRNVSLRAVLLWDSDGIRHSRKLHALVCGLNDAPAAFRNTPLQYHVWIECVVP